MTRRIFVRRWAFAAAFSASLVAAGCRSNHVDITVENRTGGAIRLLEVDYPDASFGADALRAGADFHYKVKVVGSGATKISYTDPNHKQIQINGPTLDERQQGQLEIILLPAGKAEFHPELTGE